MGDATKVDISKATPRLWRFNAGFIVTETGSIIVEVFDGLDNIHMDEAVAAANTVLVLHAVNNHDALVAALEAFVAANDDPSDDRYEGLSNAAELARRALAAARPPATPRPPSAAAKE